MNAWASECSSGCESGWTLYLEHSSHRNAGGRSGGFCEENYYEEKKYSVKHNEHVVDDDEEDLSMVSDASSGPPHFNEDEEVGYFNDVKATTKLPNNGGRRLKNKEQRCPEKEKLPCFLDDTASSPVINFSSKNDFALTNTNQASMESMLAYSQAFSATHFQGRSAFQDHFGFLQPSLSGNHLQNNQWC
ncbi:hypothetical protein AB3S75_043592 [Citrus x aurantiifolia]